MRERPTTDSAGPCPDTLPYAAGPLLFDPAIELPLAQREPPRPDTYAGPPHHAISDASWWASFREQRMCSGAGR